MKHKIPLNEKNMEKCAINWKKKNAREWLERKEYPKTSPSNLQAQQLVSLLKRTGPNKNWWCVHDLF